MASVYTRTEVAVLRRHFYRWYGLILPRVCAGFDADRRNRIARERRDPCGLCRRWWWAVFCNRDSYRPLRRRP